MTDPRFVNSRSDLIKMAWAAYQHGMAVGEGRSDLDSYRLIKMQAELNCQRIPFPHLEHLKFGIVTPSDIDRVIKLMRDVFPLEEEGSPPLG